MNVYQEKDMVKGWFIGNFDPVAFKSSDCEVCLKRYKMGDYESFHVHKITTEITMIVEGKVEMSSKEFEKGAIIVLNPGEGTDFRAIEDTLTIVVKTPSIPGDKYD